MKLYTAGGMLTKGEQLQRSSEAADIRNLGIHCYNPLENKEINDKANLTHVDLLCDRIFEHDTREMKACTHAVIEPTPNAIGTMVELGQFIGYKQISESGLKMVDRMVAEGVPAGDILNALVTMMRRHFNRKVYPHYEDIRRCGQTETGDYRSLGINQYLVGGCRYLTGGEPFYEWSEVLKELAQEVGR